MGIGEFLKYFMLTLLLAGCSERFVFSQNLSQYYGHPCDFDLVQKDPTEHVKQCNADLDPPSDNFLYVLLICFDGTCQCPDTYGIHGKKINATGYEWTPDKAQCLLSDDSECIGLAKTLCASGNCVEGRCFNATKAEIRNHGIKFLGGTTFTMIAVVLCLFLPIFNYLNH